MHIFLPLLLSLPSKLQEQWSYQVVTIATAIGVAYSGFEFEQGFGP